jgi:hypothetical protein
MTKSGEWDNLAAQIPVDLLELFCAIGRYDEIAKKYQRTIWEYDRCDLDRLK